MIVYSPETEHSWGERKIALMSGLSDPYICSLTTVQQHFLQEIKATDEIMVQANFPFLVSSSQPQQSQAVQGNLLKASWNNGRQFLLAWRKRYRLAAVLHWRSLVRSCRELRVITVSCGLEILNVCLSSGVKPEKLSVFAIGPVARRCPDVPHVLIRGSKDWVSRPFFSDVDYVIPGIGHMDYLQNQRIHELASELI